MENMIKHSNIQSLNYRKGLYLFISLFLFSSLFSQNTVEFSGIIRVGKKESYNYTIKFNVDSLGKLKGYSIFNQDKADETKTLISGTYIKNKLDFKEYKILSTKSKTSLNDMCYVHFSGEQKKVLTVQMMTGKYKGYYNNGKQCAEGSINLTNKEKLMGRVDSILYLKRDSIYKNQEDSKAVQQAIPKVNNDDSKTNISWKSDSLKFKIWDQDKVDNDRIKVMVNNVVVKEELILSDKTFEYKVPISKNMVVEIIALNKGFFPPNTSKILLLDGKTKHYFINNLNEKKSTTYNIIKE